MADDFPPSYYLTSLAVATHWWNKHGRRYPLTDYQSRAHEETVLALRTYDPSKNTTQENWIRRKLNFKLREVPGRDDASDLMSHGIQCGFPPEFYGDSLATHKEWETKIVNRIDLSRAYKTLSDKQKFVYTALMGGMSQAEISETMGVAESGVSTIRRRMIRNIRNYLGERNGRRPLVGSSNRKVIR